jgi:hypothetical protein
MGGEHSTHGRMRKANKASLENLKVRNLLEDFDIKMRITLKWI